MLGWFFVLAAMGGEYRSKLESARTAVASPVKSEVWRGYHEYQSLYMKGLLEEDKALQRRALEGLLAASERLGLDPTRYRNALKTLESEKTSLSRKGAKAKETTGSVLPEILGKRASPSERRNEAVAKKKRAPSLDKRSRKRLRLKKVTLEKENLRFRFSENFPLENLRRFVMKKGRRRLYVFDFRPVRLPFAIKRFKGKRFKEIRIAQYDPSTMRVVIETDVLYRPRVKGEGGEVRISLPGSSSLAPARKKKAASSKPKSLSSPVLPSPSKKRAAASAVSDFRGYTVVIDPGHGGKDAGAIGYRRKREKDAVLAVSKALKKILEKRGFRVYLTRESDRFIPLKQRTRFANRKQADVFVSIHANAAARRSSWKKNKGIETYFLSRARTGRAKRVAAIENSAEIKNIDRYTKEAYLSVLNREKIIESNKLAIDLQRQMLLSVRSRYKDVVDNGVREGPFWVLVGAQMPAVLVEIGYLTHPVEGKRLFTTRYQQLLARGIANGIESYIYHNK